jgi:hypothetical protein
MAHKFQPADDKYWAEQKIKREQARLRHMIATAPKTNFSELFEEEPVTTKIQNKQNKQNNHTD